ncbi:ROK family protein [Kordiimonas sp.]|uniref:ROK family protein n=1 Tax=Kordiimonas sp. TaxID=1970157 RepID=UPI003A8CE3E9
MLNRARVPVTTPEQTLTGVRVFFREALAAQDARMTALGVASFGPVNIDPTSAQYGTILDTPKPGWSRFNLRESLQNDLQVPVFLNTDVNGALLAEMTWGAAQNCKGVAYVTVGTGIGAGIYSRGCFLGHPSHPEFGHIRVKQHPADSDFTGNCLFHGDCLEGLASAKAIAARFGDPASLPEHHAIWDIEAYYLAQACLSLVLTTRVERIVLGGGILLAKGLIEKVRSAYDGLQNGYVQDHATADLIMTPGLGDDAGLKGGILLAMNEHSPS